MMASLESACSTRARRPHAQFVIFAAAVVPCMRECSVVRADDRMSGKPIWKEDMIVFPVHPQFDLEISETSADGDSFLGVLFGARRSAAFSCWRSGTAQCCVRSRGLRPGAGERRGSHFEGKGGAFALSLFRIDASFCISHSLKKSFKTLLLLLVMQLRVPYAL